MQELLDRYDFAGAYGNFQNIQKLMKKKANLIRVRGPSEFYLRYMNRFIENLSQAKKSELQKYEGKNKKDNNSKFTRFKNEIKKKSQPFANALEAYKKENDIWAEPESEEEEDDKEDDEEDEDVGFDGEDFDDEDFSFSEEDSEVDISDDPDGIVRAK